MGDRWKTWLETAAVAIPAALFIASLMFYGAKDGYLLSQEVTQLREAIAEGKRSRRAQWSIIQEIRDKVNIQGTQQKSMNEDQKEMKGDIKQILMELRK